MLSNSQAFVKMVGANVSAMEEQVTQVEGEVGTLPGAFKKIFRTMAVPGFLNVSSLYIHACLLYYLGTGNRNLLFVFRNLLVQEGNHKDIKSFPVYLGQKITLNLSLSSERETVVLTSRSTDQDQGSPTSAELPAFRCKHLGLLTQTFHGHFICNLYNES